MQAGAGIVADSDPDSEYVETSRRGRRVDRAEDLEGEPVDVAERAAGDEEVTR